MKHTTNVIESRPQADGTRIRKYRTAAGRTIRTIEVPLTVWRSSLNLQRFIDRMQSWHKGEKTRERQAVIKQRIAEGVKPLAIAHEVDIGVNEVHRIRRGVRGVKGTRRG